MCIDNVLAIAVLDHSLYHEVGGHYGVVSTCFFIGNCWGG